MLFLSKKFVCVNLQFRLLLNHKSDMLHNILNTMRAVLKGIYRSQSKKLSLMFSFVFLSSSPQPHLTCSGSGSRDGHAVAR